jgi:murein DD-endopeptidase MepM/ murein hydrolase activator NlpD
MATATGESVEQIIRRVARARGIDPDLLVAIAVQESALRPDARGDNGKSVGPFQEHEAGRGYGRSDADRMDVEASANRAATEVRQTIAKNPRDTPGQIAAKAQRPLNPGTYARNIDANLGRMKEGMSALDAAAGGVGKGGTAPPAVVAPRRPGAGVLVNPTLPARVRERPAGTTVVVRANRDAPVSDEVKAGRTYVRGPQPKRPAVSPQVMGGSPLVASGKPQASGERFWPVAGVRPGSVTNAFGATQFRSAGASDLPLAPTNNGSDLTAPYGAPIVAEMPGWVAEVYQARGDSRTGTGRDAKENGGWGGSVVVRYADGTSARYSHQRAGSIVVVPGQRVGGGQLLGQVGDSGNATGPHLDYEHRNPKGALDNGAAGNFVPGRVTAGQQPGVNPLPPGKGGKAAGPSGAPSGTLPAPASAAPSGVTGESPAPASAPTPSAVAPAGGVAGSSRLPPPTAESQAAFDKWKREQRVPDVPPAPMPSPATSQGPEPAPMPQIGTPPAPNIAPGPVSGTELLGSAGTPNTLTDDAGGVERSALMLNLDEQGPPAEPLVGAWRSDDMATETPEQRRAREAQQRGILFRPGPGDHPILLQPGATPTPTPTPTQGGSTRPMGAGSTPPPATSPRPGESSSVPAPEATSDTPIGPPGPETTAAQAPPAPKLLQESTGDSPKLKAAKIAANTAAQKLYAAQMERYNSERVVAAYGATPPPEGDPNYAVYSQANATKAAYADPADTAGKRKALEALEKEVAQAQTAVAAAETTNPADAASAAGQPNPATASTRQGQTATDQATGQTMWLNPETGKWEGVGGPKPEARPKVTAHPVQGDGVYFTDDETGQVVNHIPEPTDGKPVLLSGSDGPELLFYDPADGSIYWQQNRGFLNTPTGVASDRRDRYIIRQDKTGKTIVDENPNFDPRSSDTVLVSSTGRSIRLDADGRMVSATDTLTAEEREVYDRRAAAESESAVTKSQSEKFKLEQEQKEAEEWQRIEDAINAGATPAEVRGLVMQAAKSVADFTALQNSETQRQTQLEAGRHNLAEEGFSERTRRTAEVGEARAGVGAYQVATAPYQIAMLAGLSQVTDPRKAAASMNIAPSVFEPVAANYDAQQARQRTIDTQREGVAKQQQEPFTAPYKKPQQQAAPTASQPAGDYSSPTPSAPATPAAAPAAQAQPQAQAAPRTEVETIDLEGEGRPGYARTTYSDGTSEEWQIPLPEQPQPPPEEDEDEGGYFVGGGNGFPPLYVPRRQPPALHPGTGGGGYTPSYGGGAPRRSSKRRRLPVPGKHIIPLEDDWYQTHYDDGAIETWHRSDGSAFEGLGGGGAGFHGEDPPMLRSGYEVGTGGGGGSIWTLPPPASVDVGWGAAQALAQPDPTKQRSQGGMAGGFAGPSPATGGAGGGAYGAGGGEYGAGTGPTFGTVAPATIPSPPSNGQNRAPMWDSATPAAFATSGTGGPSGAAGSSTLFQRGASGSAGGYGITARPATAGGGGAQTGFPGRAQPASGGYYGGPGAPQAMSPLQRLLQQTGVVPMSAGRAVGAPGTV